MKTIKLFEITYLFEDQHGENRRLVKVGAETIEEAQRLFIECAKTELLMNEPKILVVEDMQSCLIVP